jgi:MFS family permease
MAELSQAPARPTGPAPTGSPEVPVIVCAGVVLASLDLFIVNVALPAIARDLGSRNLGDLSWVLNGYAIVYAALLVLAGKLADRYRRKYGFLLGVAIFTVASAACGAGPRPAAWPPPSAR